MMAVTLIFALPLLLAGAMISRTDVRLAGLVSCVVVVVVALPFVAWRTFLIGAVFPPPGESRSGSLVRFWIGRSFLVVAVMFFIGSVLDYPPAGIRIAPNAHRLIPFMPRTGLALGLFCLSMLVSSGCWGAMAPILRSEVVIRGALITGCVLFGIVYGSGWLLVS